jgi:hypothetical protein
MFSLTLLPQTLMVGGINGSVQLSVFGWNIHSWIIMTSNISKEWIAKCQVNLPEAAWDNKWTTQMSFCMLLSTHPQHRSARSRNRGCGRFTHRSIEWGCSILGGWDEFLGTSHMTISEWEEIHLFPLRLRTAVIPGYKPEMTTGHRNLRMRSDISTPLQSLEPSWDLNMVLGVKFSSINSWCFSSGNST